MSSNDGNLSTLDSSLDLALILSSLESAGREELHDELLSLSAIYDSDQTSALSIYHHTSGGGGSDSKTHRSKDSITRRAISYDATVTDTLRLTLSTTLPLDSAPDNHHPFHHGHSHDEDPKVDDKGSAARVDLLLSIPPAYPTCQPPLIQLQSMYLSSFAVTDELFGEIVRLYMHERPNAMTDTGGGGGVEWTEGQVCLYEGIECARHKCAQWVRERRRAVAALEQERTTGRIPSGTGVDSGPVRDGVYGIPWGKLDEQHVVLESLDGKTNDGSQSTGRQAPANQCPKILSTEGLLDRKSLFVGHVAEVHSAEEVQLVMSTLLSNSKIAKATHNISAHRFLSPDGIQHQDNDDDGESAAGSRLAHLLQLLDVNNVLVVVSRWYGGVHLGADRFKDINQVARDALQLGGFLDGDGAESGKKGTSKNVGGKKKR